MSHLKPFLTRCSREARTTTEASQTTTPPKTEITPQPPTTLLTKVRSETTDDS